MGAIGKFVRKFLAGRFFPDQVVNGVFDIDLDALRSRGISGLIFDIDNTLAKPGSPKPGGNVAGWLNAARDGGFSLCFLTNAGRRRGAVFSSGLGIFTVTGAKKPGRHGYAKALRLMGRGADEVCAVGDQVFTDVRGAKRLGIYSIYTRPFTLAEVFTVVLKRFPEALILKIRG